MKRKAGVCLTAALCLALSACQAPVALQAEEPVTYTFEEVSVHDPSIVEGENGEYYIFGSHMAVAKTSDLMNWESINQGVKQNSKVIPKVYDQMKEAFAWSHSDTFWAPDVVQLKDGRWAMYYCNCQGDAPVSCLGLAIADEIAGPYTN